MVKSKKIAASKKAKSEDITEIESPTENAVDVKSQEDSENASQENGEVDVNIKKKGKAKTSKKEDETSDDESKKDEDEVQENGAGDATEKKKAAKKGKTPAKTKPKSDSEPARKSSRTPKPVTKQSEEEAFEVEELVDSRVIRGKTQFLVRWKGYKQADDTWEDEESLNCPTLLQKFKEDSSGKQAKKRSAAKSPAKSDKKAKKEEEDFEVEEIVGMRVKNGKKEFKIRWKGYKASDDSWEPEKHLSCQDLIEEYIDAHKDEVEEEETKAAEKKPTKKAKSPAKSLKKKSRAK